MPRERPFRSRVTGVPATLDRKGTGRASGSPKSTTSSPTSTLSWPRLTTNWSIAMRPTIGYVLPLMLTRAEPEAERGTPSA